MRAIVSSTASRWVLLALAGIAVAIAVGVIASQLTSQRIGLASESLKAGEALAPDRDGRGAGGGNRGGGGGGHGEEGDRTTTSTSSTTTPATTTMPTSTSETEPPTGDDYRSEDEEGDSAEDD